MQLSLTTDFNQVVVTSVRIDRLGSAFNGDTVAGGAKLYDDLDNDEALNVGEPLLGSGSFASGSVTITIGKAVTAGTPENVLIAVYTNAAVTPAITLGVELATIAFLTVSGGDVVSSAAFPLRSTTTLLAAPAPSLFSATAVDNNAGQPGVQAGDTVALVFDRSTNASAVTAANINTALALNNGHSWLDGDSVIGSAAWSITTVSNETVPITFSAGTGAPAIAVGDSLTVGAGTIRDVTSTNDATGSPPTIGGAFGEDSLTVSAVDLASTNVDRGKADAPFLLLTLTAAQNSVVVTQIRVDPRRDGGRRGHGHERREALEGQQQQRLAGFLRHPARDGELQRRHGQPRHRPGGGKRHTADALHLAQTSAPTPPCPRPSG